MTAQNQDMTTIMVGTALFLALCLSAFFTGQARGWNTRADVSACEQAIADGFYTRDLLGQCLDDYRDSTEGGN